MQCQTASNPIQMMRQIFLSKPILKSSANGFICSPAPNSIRLPACRCRTDSNAMHDRSTDHTSDRTAVTMAFPSHPSTGARLFRHSSSFLKKNKSGEADFDHISGSFLGGRTYTHPYLRDQEGGVSINYDLQLSSIQHMKHCLNNQLSCLPSYQPT